PLLHLYEAALLRLLEQAGAIAIPTAVDHEMVQYVQAWHTGKPPWVLVTPVRAPYAAQATAWQQSGLLEAGEAGGDCPRGSAQFRVVPHGRCRCAGLCRLVGLGSAWIPGHRAVGRGTGASQPSRRRDGVGPSGPLLAVDFQARAGGSPCG